MRACCRGSAGVLKIDFLFSLFIQTVYCGSSVGRDVSSSTRENQVDKFTTYCLHDHSQPGLVLFPEEIKPDKATLITSENNCSKNGSIHQTEYGMYKTSEIFIMTFES